jgi:hypothetical protein
VSSLPLEGQFLPELKGVMREKPWDTSHQLPWPLIKEAWESHWDKSKPILLEKSPPNIIRTREILTHFQPVKFVLMVRNPYAQTEGLMRRNNWTAKRAANFSMMCLRTQLDNSRTLDDVLVLTYESLAQNPASACEKLIAFIPGLNDIDPNANFEVHSIDGTLDRPITDLNARKIATLSTDDLSAMNEVFEQHRETIAAWDYDLMHPSANK